MTTSRLILFSREVCPLCDDAAALLDAAGLVWQEHDIDDDLELLNRYRTKIPVLRDQQAGSELAWPFTAVQLRAFLDEHNR